MIPMLDLKREYNYMRPQIDAAIRGCMAHQKWILGPEVLELEVRIAKYLEVTHCVGLSSGTEALVVALRAMALKTKGKEYFTREDRIITTPFTFTATGDAILRAGATPVFVDVDDATLNIDPAEVEACLQRDSAVGIIPVHLYGQSCDMDKLSALAAEHSLFLVEDTAQALGGKWGEQKLGSLGDASAMSFFPSKNLGGFGDGGMLATHDDETADLVRQLRKHGGRDKYNVDHIGYNARLDTLQAAILLAKLDFFSEFTQHRRKIAQAYTLGLREIDELTLPVCLDKADHVYHQFTIRVHEGKRDALKAYLQDQGISTMVYYPLPLHLMAVFQEGRSILSGPLEVAEKACHEVLSLPMEPLQKPEETAQVIGAIQSFFVEL